MNIIDQSLDHESDIAPQATFIHEPFIVTCPACHGGGRVLRDDSQVPLACRLCWEHGVVASIVANKYLRSAQPTQNGTDDHVSQPVPPSRIR